MEILLHGYLKELHPDPIKVEASTVAEALSSLQLIPAFNPSSGKKYHVRIEGFESADALCDPDAAPRVVNVHPVVAGAGGRGMGQIIIGALVIAAAFFAGPAGVMGISQASLYLAGGMMVLGGLLQMLAPQPEYNNDSTRSQYLGSGKNTTAIGTRIPLILGRHKAGGQYLSFDIDTGDLNSAPASWYSSPFTDHGELTFSAAPAETPMLPPEQVDFQPQTYYMGLSYPSDMSVEDTTFINFYPQITLEVGEWDINFTTGQTLHVLCESPGLIDKVTLLGGSPIGLPAEGTGIVFTRNYG